MCIALEALILFENIFHLVIDNQYHLCYIISRLSLSSPKYNTQQKAAVLLIRPLFAVFSFGGDSSQQSPVDQLFCCLAILAIPEIMFQDSHHQASEDIPHFL